ncbi:hypothetical protein Adt_41902 [Abeliophyllum distichum]|uniref:Uncharacterized protein n=1 Tax=Abeliophyllum distichum TaxID=126358 RepID=A0ABD1PQ67_9LAMI
MVAHGGAKGNFPRMSNQGRQTGLWNQGYKAEVNEVTPTKSKTISEVSAPKPQYDNHDTEECPDVRATVDKMMENRYKPTRRSQMGQHSYPWPMNYAYNRGQGRRTRGEGYHLVQRVPQKVNQERPNAQHPAVQPPI